MRIQKTRRNDKPHRARVSSRSHFGHPVSMRHRRLYRTIRWMDGGKPTTSHAYLWLYLAWFPRYWRWMIRYDIFSVSARHVSGGETPPPRKSSTPPGNFLQAAISWTGHTIYVAVIILEATLRTGISGYAVLGRQISKKIVHTAAAWSVITDAVAAAVPVVITD